MNPMALKEKDPEIILYNAGKEENRSFFSQYKAQALLSCITHSYF
jgi:hypothetical protein